MCYVRSMDKLKKVIEAHPELAHLQGEITEWLEDYESLIEERNALQKELEHLRALLDETAPETD